MAIATYHSAFLTILAQPGGWSYYRNITKPLRRPEIYGREHQTSLGWLELYFHSPLVDWIVG